MKLIRFEPSNLSNVEALSKQPEMPENDEVHLWVLREEALKGFEKKRASLRAVLAHYTGIAPEALEFEEQKDGKPILKADQNPTALHFNLSHTHGIQLIAITRWGEVGVDIEKVRELKKLNALLDRFYFPSERERIEASAPEQKLRMFFTIWTAKEAWAKARGKSVFQALAHYEWNPESPSVALIPIDQDYIAHLAVHHPDSMSESDAQKR